MEAVGVQWWESLFRCASVSDEKGASVRYGHWSTGEVEQEGATYQIVHYCLRYRGVFIDIWYDCAKRTIGLRVVV